MRKVYGVFVGINKYKDARIRNLKYAVSDAQKFYSIVTNRLERSEQKTWLLVDSEATRKNVKTIIGNDLADVAKEEDIVMLYFSCHGSPEISKNIDNISRYLIMYDTEYRNIFATGVDLEKEIPILLKRIRAKLIFVFIDSCFSGKAGGRTFEGYEFSQVSPRGPDGKISLQNLALGEGRIIITACDDNEVAREDPRLGHGIFTFELLRTLTDRRYGKPTIRIGQLYSSVCERVENYGPSDRDKQHPVFNGRDRGAHIPIFAI